MAKNKSEDQAEKKEELTEWQKRNLEFLQKKERDKKEKEEQDARLRAQKRARILGEEIEEEAPKPSKTKKKRVKKAKKVKTKSVKKLSKAEEKARRRLRSIVIPSVLIFFFSLFMVSPLSKLRVVKVTGNTNSTTQEVETASGIQASDYLVETMLNQSSIAKEVVANDKWVKSAKVSYQFWNTFVISVQEYSVVAYLQTSKGYSPVLEDGTVVSETNLTSPPDQSMVLTLTDTKQIKSFIKQVDDLSDSLKQNMHIVSLANSASTPDLLSIEMYDGNTVKVPLSQLTTKMPYYTKIVANMTETGIVDMEVGIYTTTASIEEGVASALAAATETTTATSDQSSTDASETTAAVSEASSSETSSSEQTNSAEMTTEVAATE
ncbi:cell division protein FtsQ/DivIB [Streptococcus loxodontisalivarius]|uniref:Cell division protein DivIB n=1 Tax=Streptococcus loxodontisalivarius TaxID=1349415 RepID=A0ABS2PRE5_9STRE|nr:FtsQ-type POTRA domain-containing protein [Streptococcus loxodontisalivarius]MBM7642613.1 cell division protein FtsQ [Streptococcus loxodontisalivarius]